MNAHPLGVNPGAKDHHCRKLVGIRFLSAGQHHVQFPNEHMEPALKFRQFAGNFGRIHAALWANPHLDFFEARFAADRARTTRIGHGEVLHEERLPALCRGYGWVFAPLSGENNLIENPAEVPAQVGGCPHPGQAPKISQILLGDGPKGSI
jgi:hypothetical protein